MSQIGRRILSHGLHSKEDFKEVTSAPLRRPEPSVGVAVVVWKGDFILLGEDHGGKGPDMVYGVPGGHWESGESLSEAARREVLEEAGIVVDDLSLASVHDFYRPDKSKSYVTIGFAAKWRSGEPQDESEVTRKRWAWYSLEALPEPLFPPDKILIERFRSGLVFGDQ